MTTAERLDEVAEILGNAVIRQRKPNKTNDFGESLTGLQRGTKHSCHANQRKEDA